MKRVKEYQTLIAGLSLALALIYAGSSVLLLAFRAGEAVSQHNQIIGTQAEMLRLVNERCR